MEAFSPRGTKQSGPEEIIQGKIISMMTGKGWLVKSTHGNVYQFGFPDLYCAHKMYGARWIEVKNPLAYTFTKAQLDFFPRLSAVGVGVWVLVDATEYEYRKLWEPANWQTYLKIWSPRKPRS